MRRRPPSAPPPAPRRRRPGAAVPGSPAPAQTPRPRNPRPRPSPSASSSPLSGPRRRARAARPRRLRPRPPAARAAGLGGPPRQPPGRGRRAEAGRRRRPRPPPGRAGPRRLRRRPHLQQRPGRHRPPPSPAADAVLISPNAGASTFAGKGCNPNLFVTSYENNQVHEVGGQVAQDRGYKRAFLLAPQLPGRQGRHRRLQGPTSLVRSWTRTTSPLTQLDFSADLARIAAARPDVVYAFMPGGLGVNLVKQFRQSGLADTVPFLSAFTVDESTLPAQGRRRRRPLRRHDLGAEQRQSRQRRLHPRLRGRLRLRPPPPTPCRASTPHS